MACGCWFDHWVTETASGDREIRRYQESKAGPPDVLSVSFNIGEIEPAQRDLDEAMSIAERGGMGEKPEAREHWVTAKEMVEDMGYHRRDKEVEKLEEEVKE